MSRLVRCRSRSRSRVAAHAAALLAAAAGATLPAPAAAQDLGGWSVGALHGQGVRRNFADALWQAPAGQLDWVHSWEDGVFVRRDITPDGWRRGERADGLQLRSQVQVNAYAARGLRDNRAFAIDWRAAARWPLGAGFTGEAAFGLGWWHSAGTAWYNHSGSPELDAKYHNLLHLVPELTLRHRALPGFSAGVRIDHASGAYGLLAPDSLGTNHVGFVAAVDF